MKKLSLFTSLALSGALLLGGCAQASGYTHQGADAPTDAFQERTYTVADPASITSIDLTDLDTNVEVAPSGDGAMSLTYFENKHSTYDIDVTGGVLSIEKHYGSGWLDFFQQWGASDDDDLRIVLCLPTDYSGTLKVDVGDGDTRIGAVGLSDLEINCIDGDVVLDGTAISGAMRSNLVDGDITLGASAATMDIGTADGDIKFNNTKVSKSLTCETADGDISGILNGMAEHYTSSIKTREGESNVNSGGTGDILLQLTTLDGDIQISFEGDT